MNNLETLKNELITQKTIIEEKGGQVVVANTNPSPSEITTGLTNLPVPNLTISTATESDVASGKTFYSQNATLKTGTSIDQTELICSLIGKPDSYPTTITTPDSVTEIRSYAFYYSPCTSNFVLNNNVTKIERYAFRGSGFQSFSFNNTTNLLNVDSYALSDSDFSIDISNLPNSIQNFGTAPFSGSQIYASGDIVIPSSLILSSNQLFYKNNTGFEVNGGINFNGAQSATYGDLSFANCGVSGTCTVPSMVILLGKNCFLNHKFSTVIIPASVTNIGDYCFKTDTTTPSELTLSTVIIERPTPASRIGLEIFKNCELKSDFSIYVPDSSVNDYKTASGFTTYANYIKPLSLLPA